MEIIIFGAPGVGKGTQAKVLAKDLNIPHISTGDILRAAVEEGTELGKIVKGIMEKGELVTDDLMAKLVREMLFSDRCKNGFILDGYPRTIPQVHIFEGIREELNLKHTCLLEIKVDFDIIVKRLTSRLLCVKCNSIITEEQIVEPDTCPVCGGKNSLIKRKDDTLEVVQNRLKVYKEATEPIINFYKEKGSIKIVSVDGNQPVEKVTESIEEELKNC
jgi:adenylate kinase